MCQSRQLLRKSRDIKRCLLWHPGSVKEIGILSATDRSLGQPGVEGGLQLPTLPIPTLQGGGMLLSHHHGGERLAQAPRSCCHGLKAKIILWPTAVLGEEHGLSQGGETIASPACRACARVWLNLRAVTIK